MAKVAVGVVSVVPVPPVVVVACAVPLKPPVSTCMVNWSVETARPLVARALVSATKDAWIVSVESST